MSYCNTKDKGKGTNLELRGKIVLYEPKFDRAVCVLHNTQHHNFQKSLIPVLPQQRSTLWVNKLEYKTCRQHLASHMRSY